MLKKISQLISFGAVIMLVLTMMPLPQDLPTFAAAGDWKPDGAAVFTHGTGISRGTAAQVQPVTSVGPSLTARTITPTNLTADGHVYDCSVANPNNKLSEIDNNHYFPDGIGYSSFNNYRNEFTAAFDPANPPNTFFNSGVNNEVERNYLGGAYDSNPALGAPTDAKDNINLLSFADPTRDLYLLAHVHNNASTALNPTGAVDSRSTLPNGGGSKDLSARAVNTRMHFSVPSLAIPDSTQGTFVNRLRANNAYHVDGGNTCNDLVQQQVSDISKVTNTSGQPVTFIVKSGFIQNPFDSTGASDINFSASALAQLVDPSLNQSHITDPRSPSQLSASEGARISSGKSATGAFRNVPNQPGCINPLDAGQQANCNRFADPVLAGLEFDGEWYGSREFARYVGINVDAVAAAPNLSVSKLVRSVSPNPENFNYAGSPWAPTSTSITGTGNGEVEYEVLIQNTGNVDLDDVNFADVLPPELAPKQPIPGVVEGTVEICTNLAAAQNPAACTGVLSSIPLNIFSGNSIVLSSNDMGIGTDAFEAPLHRDPTFITTGSTADGEVIRIRWRMTSVCSTDDSPVIALNYGLVTGSSSEVPATVNRLDALPETPLPHNISSGQWATLFGPGAAPLIENPDNNHATNTVSVTLNHCNPDVPQIRIGKFVRRESPGPAETFFPNPHSALDTVGGRTVTTITGTGGGEVQYEVLIENTGSGSINSLSFGDNLPTELTLKPNTITAERCKDLEVATRVPDTACTDDPIVSIPDSNVVGGVLYIDGNEMGTAGVGSGTAPDPHPLQPGQVIRIRWSMTSVCNPQTPNVLNYAMVMGSSGTGSTIPLPANIQVFPGLAPHSPPPFEPSVADMQNQFEEPNGVPGPTNDTFVQVNPCSPPPPPPPNKRVSITPHPAGPSFATPLSFQDANTTGTAVDFGVKTAPYTAYFRVSLTNTSTTNDLTDVIMDDEFHLRNGVPVTPQSVVEPVLSNLDTFDVAGGIETALIPQVQYMGASPTTVNGIRFRIPRLLHGHTIAFYYSIVVDPTVAVPPRPAGTEFHKNTVRVCFPQTTPTGNCIDGGSDDAFFSDRTPPPSLTLNILKTVNGQDADTDLTAVSVANGGGLSYVVTVTAPASNTAPVTGISLTDTVTTLPNVTSITNIRLVTPAGPCIAPAGCAVANIQTDLPTRLFDLAPGQSAVLTYSATATNAGTSTSAFNRNTATATPNNAPPVSNPATIVVPGNRPPETDFEIEKEVSREAVRNGDEITYTITVSPADDDNDEIDDLVLLITDDINEDGTLRQGGVTITYIPNSTDIETEDADCEGEMDDEDGIRCENVSADDEIVITYRARVTSSNLNCPDIVEVDNTAELRDDTPNVDIEDEDDAMVRTICSNPPPLTISKNVDRVEVRRGEIANYTIVVHNPNSETATTRLTDTIGLNGGTVPGQNGGRVRFIPGSLQITGAGFTGSISSPEGVVLTIPGNGTATIRYQASGEPEANQTMISLAPNTATLDTGAYATAFVQLPTTGPEAAAAIGLISALGAYIATRRRKK